MCYLKTPPFPPNTTSTSHCPPTSRKKSCVTSRLPHSLQIQHQPVTVHHQLVEQYAKSLYPNSSAPSYDPSKHRLLQIKKHVIRLNSHYSHLTVTATATTIDIIITPQLLHIFVTSHNNLCSPYTVSNFCRDEKFFNTLYH